MIRYEIAYEELVDQVSAMRPNWLSAAAARTRTFRRLKRFEDPSPIWSEIKPIFMNLQHAKCAYCERKLESSATGTIEWDVEHYRPKSAVSRWKNQKTSEGSIPGGLASQRGYYLLPYHLLNYLASCKVCNSTFKGTYFPVRGRRELLISDPRHACGEQALLPYPIGDLDNDPEDLLTFQGFVCIPRHYGGARRERALITIDFFGLNSRTTLLIARAELIVTLFRFLESARDGADTAYLRKNVESGKSAHVDCGRAFLAVHKTDPDLAAEFAQKALRYLQSENA